MTETITTLVLCGVALVVVLIVVGQLARYVRGTRGGQGLPYEPVPELYPPAPIVATPRLFVLGAAGCAWAVLHVVAAALWATKQVGPAEVADRFPAMVIYVCVAAVMVGTGAVMMMARFAYGRRMIAMGELLLVLVAFIGLVASVLFPVDAETPRRWIIAARWIAVAMFVHLVIDAVIGHAAQRVGLAEESPPDDGSRQAG